MKKFIASVILLCLSAAFVITSCSRDRATPDLSFSDAKLFAMITDSTGAKYYKDAANTSQFTTTTTSASFHGNAFYEMRMNKKAFDACTSSGKLPSGGTFPDSSLIVKQLHSSASGPITYYAAMYKLNGSWSWAMFKTDGTADLSINDHSNNATCISCHQPQSRDFVRTFDEHP